MPFDGGPFIQAACFCDMVLEDKGGSLSLIRIIDVLNHADEPKEMPTFLFNSNLVIMLKGGRVSGRHEVSIRPELPSGSSKEPINLTVHLSEERGQNLILKMTFPIEQEGLYWFHIYFDEDRFSSIPLRVDYHRAITQGPGPQLPA